MSRILVIVGVLVLCFVLVSEQGLAQGPLPSVPAADIVNKVIEETQGPTHTPLGVPQLILDQFSAITDASFDVDRAVYYFDVTGGLRRIAVPISDAENAQLAPATNTEDGLPALVVGAIFEPETGARVIMAVWQQRGNNQRPAELRFYSQPGQFETPFRMVLRRFRGNNSGRSAPGDVGAAIAARETCFAIGLDQVCYVVQGQPPRGNQPEEVRELAEAAADTLTAAYNIRTRFDLDGALADLAGNDVREQCSAQLAELEDTASMPGVCAATIVFTAAERLEAGQPIGLFHVVRDVELKTYDVQGNFIGTLFAGDYLVLDATPASVANQPGAIGALFLVNADGTNHYLIPSQVVEAFGETDDPEGRGRRGQAAIKHGTVSYRDF